MARRPTSSGTLPKLSEVARHVVAPKGVTSNGWPAVRDKAAEFGVTFRPWQEGAGRLILAKTADGKYAATVGGTGLSIPRQVGKTFLVGAIVFALCILRPRLTVIWTAHRLRTAEETFGKMQAFAGRKKIAPHILKVVLGSGEEEIRFRNGSRILFGARESGFGLGFDEVDVLIFDEAQRLRDLTLDDMVPATNQSRQDTGALLLFMGTPPRPTDPGEVFTRMRKDALSGEDDTTGWLEFGADVGYEPTRKPAPLTVSDWKQVAKANPSFPADTPKQAILRMRKQLTDESFVREGLGVWDDEDVKGDLPYARWKDLADPDAERGVDVCFGADVAEDRSAWVAVAWRRQVDAAVQVMLVNDGQALPAYRLADEAKRLTDEWAGPVMGPRSFEDEFDKAGVDVLPPMTQVDAAEVCSQFDNWIRSGEIRHGNQTALNESVRLVKWRTSINPAERTFQLKDAPEAGPVMAVVRAIHGLEKYQSGFAIH